ncbi:unnamed protein product [Ambrosiozyma monospora]|uniref:Unnamed protein product n=1 Tax=Ambrosiozyma monospora TaxID=43982 RepID=A0ACB5TTP2_AMBMO|nr:unnamed protein product [Ambrosiozyma monospora]
MLGDSFDELCRHHPELKPIVQKNVMKLIKEIPPLVKFPTTTFFQSPKSSLYYSRDEPVLTEEEGCAKMTSWETTVQGDVLECAAAFLEMLVGSYNHNSHNHWKDFYKEIKMQDLIKFITPENNAFDYVLSNCLSSISMIIKAIDQVRPGFALQEFINTIGKYFGDISEFIHYESDSSSYFDKFDQNSEEAGLAGGVVLSKLTIINSLLFIMSDVYTSPNKLSTARVQLFAKTFQKDNNTAFLKEMVSFFRRIVLEETIAHSRTPYAAAKDVTCLTGRQHRYHVEIGEPGVSAKDWIGSSAKYKNLSVLFFHFNKCQLWTRYTLATLCRLSADKRQESKFGVVPN